MPKAKKTEFWQPALFLIAFITLLVIIFTSGLPEDIKLFAVNITVTGLLAIYVLFVIRQKLG
jgi:hypothetical protein